MVEKRSGLTSLAVAGVLAGCALAAPWPANAQQKSEEKRTYTFRIEAGPMSRVLASYSEVSGVQLVYDSEFVKGVSSAGLAGAYTADEALNKVLEGSGLEARFTSSTTATVIRSAEKGARILGPVRVEGAQEERPRRGEGVAQLGGIRGGQDQEARGYRPVVATAGTYAPTAIEDIPRSVSVLTQEQVEKQDINDIGEALKRIPGVTLIEANNDTTVNSSIISRGMTVNSVQVDGNAALPLDIVDNGLLDIGPYERIELVRGPNGAFTGDGSPGGTLQLVRKRPGMAESFSVNAIGGSWNRRQIGVDYSTPGIAGSPIAFRGTATWADQEFFNDLTERRNWLVYGLFDAPLGDDARLELGFQRSDIAEIGGYRGIPRYVEGPLIELPRTYNLSAKAATQDSVTSELFGRFIMGLPRDWNFSASVSFNARELTRVKVTGVPTFSQITNAIANSVSRQFDLTEYRAEQNLLSTSFSITGREHTFGIDHDLSITGQFREVGSPEGTMTRLGPVAEVRTVADINPLVFAEGPFIAREVRPTTSTATASGLTLGDTLSWRDKVDLVLAVRRTESASRNVRRIYYLPANTADPRYGQITSISYSPAGGTDPAKRQAYWKPSWSVVLKPVRGLSVYGDLSSGTSPQDQFYDLSDQQLGPQMFENKELGLKYGTRGWVASLSVYDMDKSNVADSIPDTEGLCLPTPESLCYYAQGASLKSRGVDFEINGEVLKGLGVGASYNYNKTTKEPGVRDAAAAVYTEAPSRMAKLLVDWSPWFLPATSFSLNASYRSEVYQAGTLTFYDPVTRRLIPPSIPYEFTEPSYVVVDMGVNHAFNRELSLNLFIENVTDKDYLSTVSRNYNFVGKPRSFTASVRWNPQGDAPANGRSPTTGMAPFGEAGSWYGSFELGRHDGGTLTGTSEGLKLDGTPAVLDFEVKPDTLSFARLGYRIDSHWRVEAEGGFRGATFGRIGGRGTGPNGVCDARGSSEGLPFNCEDAPGDANAWSLMFNGLYDFLPARARVRPFVGVGLGVSRWSIDFGGKMKGVGPDTPWSAGPAARSSVETLAGVDQSYAWSWQVTTGATLRWTDRAFVTAAYTFYNAPDLEWRSFNARTATPELGLFKGSMKDQSLTLGLRWFFGDPAR